ncbi:Multiprotein-bridging factor 1b [Gracilariopsis chorda]|uniref:Multiprotein-bridging factor 1b n=1 Tax=Gracilariopsis chorda TaxID=448386 RepID=A0A2V3IE38_9FLOR|nr:Multiprotein-bridging factor 1b [Gracilariopsis chorda]|eukprot:PXF40311.1 Multiprotein-bridging factor 1b [Gracilariopsis chorda]
MSHQDWDKVVIRPKASSSKKPEPGAGGTPTEKKFAAGSNAKRGDANMAKLDADNENLSHKRVGLTLGKAIQKARAEKKMTQADLAKAINEKPAVVNQYENGKALPNGQIIVKIERALGTKLPRQPKK